jgi:hypothetical protein
MVSALENVPFIKDSTVIQIKQIGYWIFPTFWDLTASAYGGMDSASTINRG